MSGLRGKDRPGAADVRAAEDSSQRDDLVVEFGFPAASEAAIGSDGRQVDVGHGPELAADERRVSAWQLSAWLTLVCATCIVVVALQSLALGGLRVDAPMVQYTGPDGTTIAPLITDQVEYLRMVDHYRVTDRGRASSPSRAGSAFPGSPATCRGRLPCRSHSSRRPSCWREWSQPSCWCGDGARRGVRSSGPPWRGVPRSRWSDSGGRGRSTCRCSGHSASSSGPPTADRGWPRC